MESLATTSARLNQYCLDDLGFSSTLPCQIWLFRQDPRQNYSHNCNRMNVAAITIDGAFTTRCSRFLHAKQESDIMMILTSVLANLFEYEPMI